MVAIKDMECEVHGTCEQIPYDVIGRSQIQKRWVYVLLQPVEKGAIFIHTLVLDSVAHVLV